jgi:hypothetical protein
MAKARFRERLEEGEFVSIALDVIRIESRTNLLFSFEKMALRDAVAGYSSSRKFAVGLYDFLHGAGPVAQRFETWVKLLATLPRRQTRVLTWPAATVFGFFAQPKIHFFL